MITALIKHLEPYTLLIKIGLVVAVLGATWVHGYRYRGHVEDTAKLELVLNQAKAREAMQKASNLKEIELEAKAQQRETRTKTVYKEVTKYVQNTTACKLDAGYRSLHDYSAGNGSTATGPVLDEANRKPQIATGTDSNAVLETLADNYSTCLRWKDQVDGWQGFWKDVIKK